MSVPAPAPLPPPADQLQAVIITGLSGSGKSTALKAFEDCGYYCVDNLPLVLLPDFLAVMAAAQPPFRRVALVMDARERVFLGEYKAVFAAVAQGRHRLEILFLEATDEVLVLRFSQTRRRHPLAAEEGGVPEAIARERARFAGLRAEATRILDTSRQNVHQLREAIFRLYAGRSPGEALRVSLLSFGFKHGLPPDADLVLDVRFLPNPHFVPLLRPRTGQDPEVAAYVLDHDEADRFLHHLVDLLLFLLPLYRREGKAYLTVAIGCTGGKHRSVAVAEALACRLAAAGEPARVGHRDMGRE
ncbi:MAG: RNase adapter RapZ [Thermodesulfobacteriota bacterium]